MKRILSILILSSALAFAADPPPVTPSELSRGECEAVVQNHIKALQTAQIRNLIETHSAKPLATQISEAEAAQVALRQSTGAPPPSAEELQAVRDKVTADFNAAQNSAIARNAELDRQITALRASLSAGQIVAPAP